MITSKQIIKKLNESLFLESGAIRISTELARQVGDLLAINWDQVDFDQFHKGINIEFEHGDVNAVTDVIAGPDNLLTSKLIAAKIALAHINEIPDYYTRLVRMEKEAGIED
jgi:hypothetical protein